MPDKKHPDSPHEAEKDTAESPLQSDTRQQTREFLSPEPEPESKDQPVLTAEEIKALRLEEELRQFTGSEQYHRSSFGRILLTDGAHYLREMAGCYWFIDLIASYQRQLWGEKFQLWEITVNEDRSAVVICRRDTGRPPLVEQKIEFTDFPLKHYELYCVHGVILLKSEY